MSRYLTVSFLDDSGNPATGLSPVITIRKVSDSSVIINSQAMTEIGNGMYKYLFLTISPVTDYVFVCDSVTLSNRYAYGLIDSNSEWDEQLTDHTTNGSFGNMIQDNFKGVGL